MRVLFPLFQFKNLDMKEFKFDNDLYSLERFNGLEALPDIPLFSERDKSLLDMVLWCIVAEGDLPDNYEEEVNTLMIVFRLVTKRSASVGYKICKEVLTENKILYETMTHISNSEPAKVKISDLELISKYFDRILAMDSVSNRTHNSLYFLYRATHNVHWVDCFIFFIGFLESLFSKDNKGGATKIVCTRVSRFLNNPELATYDSMEKMYGLRSDMVHGRVKLHHIEPRKNLSKLKELERICFAVLSKYLSDELYQSYSEKPSREKLLMNYS